MKMNVTRTEHEKCFSQEGVELGDKQNTCGNSDNSSNEGTVQWELRKIFR